MTRISKITESKIKKKYNFITYYYEITCVDL